LYFPTASLIVICFILSRFSARPLPSRFGLVVDRRVPLCILFCLCGKVENELRKCGNTNPTLTEIISKLSRNQMAESIVTKSYKFRIFPGKAQTTKLVNTLDLCRFLYNSALQERRDAYKLNRISLNYYDQANQLKEIKETNPEYKDVHSQISQGVLKRVDKAFQAFFRRIKTKQKAGFPRFQGKHRYNSFTFAQSGFSLADNRLTLSKIGKVKIKLHREIIGKVKTLTISRDSCGKWFACFVVETAKEILEPTNQQVGIDAGLAIYAKFSDETEIDNPRFFRKSEKRLATAQQRLSAQVKGSRERHRKRKIIAKIHSKIKNQRSNFTHQLSRFLVNNYDVIVFEKLQMLNMMQNHCIAKSIADASWGTLIEQTRYKAENAGRIMIQINPAYTSQTCRICGHCEKANRQTQAVFECVKCHHAENADANAAKNILSAGLRTLDNQFLEATSKRFGLVVE
jgi:putative transposase